ncbi:FecR domain-containing protein [Lutimaribacter marinistellae]|uniref:FecR domain-containing protein n=1 Tax=Lutimaribacter marinistellae TaxID=1820329 RepID=A0ABV7TJS9_9RHOB
MRDMLHRPLLAALMAGTALVSTAALAQESIGTSAAVNTASTLERGASQRTVVIGDDIAFKDRIITNRDGLVQVLFVDGSTFTVGSNSRVVIDEFVYNPSDGTGSLTAEVTRGALRFVGGKLSKNEEPVRFKTPVGILGVRGAIAEIDLEPACLSSGECPDLVANLVFGDELTFTGPDGRRSRIYQPGHSFVISRSGQGVNARIVQLKTLDRGTLQRRLQGQSGQNGGAIEIPTDRDVAESGIPRENSDRSPYSLRLNPGLEMVSTAIAPDPDEPGIASTDRQLAVSVLDEAQSDFIREDVGSEPEGPIYDRATLTGVFGTPDSYTTPSGVVIEDPWAQGISRIVPPETVTVQVLREDGEPVGIELGDISLPYPVEEGETPIEPRYSETYQRDVVGGTILRGPDGIAIYHLALSDYETESPGSLDVVVGQPTPREVFFPSTDQPADLRTYELGEDYARTRMGLRSDVPLLNPQVAFEFGNEFLSAAAETPFYVIETGQSRYAPTTLYGALRIEGQGADQRSMIVSDTGFVFGNLAGTGEDALGIGGTRRGSYRFSAQEEINFMRGGTGSNQIQSPTIFTAIAGRNAEAFVYGSGLNGGLARNNWADENTFIDAGLMDPIASPADPQRYSSATVPAFLTMSERLDGFDRTITDDRLVHGFAAGMVEGQEGSATPFRSIYPGGAFIAFDPVTASLGGTIDVADTTGTHPAAFAFSYGFGFDGEGEFPAARSAFLDSTRFAANSTGPSNVQGGNTTFMFSRTEEVIAHQPYDPEIGFTGRDPGTYVVSAGLVPQDNLFSGADVSPCRCDFMQWGWWGTQTEFRDSSLTGGSRTDMVHLGTFVTADIPTAAELPMSGRGEWRGHAIGNVAVDGELGTRRYVAVGDMAMDFDFAERVGTLSIDNFDGRSFSGPMGSSGVGDALNRFDGPLSGDGLSGSATGSFARGPLGPDQGVLGSFDVGGFGYSAAGTFMGER